MIKLGFELTVILILFEFPLVRPPLLQVAVRVKLALKITLFRVAPVPPSLQLTVFEQPVAVRFMLVPAQTVVAFEEITGGLGGFIELQSPIKLDPEDHPVQGGDIPISAVLVKYVPEANGQKLHKLWLALNLNCQRKFVSFHSIYMMPLQLQPFALYPMLLEYEFFPFTTLPFV
jgi:hypothetical protein